MAIVEDVSAQLTEAMRARETTRVAVLRMMRAALLNEMKKNGAETLADEVSLAVLRRLEKQRKESIEAFAQAGREDRAEQERAELVVVQAFLPSLADEATTRGWVEAAIAESGASGPKQLGQVMGALMKAHKGDVDGKLARRIAAGLLGTD